MNNVGNVSIVFVFERVFVDKYSCQGEKDEAQKC